MRAWCAFDAADIHNMNVLSINELKILLWIFEDAEPGVFKLKSEMSRID